MNEIYFDKKLERLGSTIKILRLERRISQEKLAKLAEIDRSHLQKIENGRNFSIVLLMKICLALGVEEQDVFAFAKEAHTKIFIRNANKLVTNEAALPNDEVKNYANKIKALREVTKIKGESKTKCLVGGDKSDIMRKRLYKIA